MDGSHAPRGLLRVALLVSRQRVDHLVAGTAIKRVTIADRHVETIFGLGDSTSRGWHVGPWLGTTPDGWPVTTLDAGTHDIYALDWEAP